MSMVPDKPVADHNLWRKYFRSYGINKWSGKNKPENPLLQSTVMVTGSTMYKTTSSFLHSV